MKEILNYESIENNINLDNNEKLFYSIIYRRWDCVNKHLRERKSSWEELKKIKFRDSEITIEKCFEKNLQFLKSNKNRKYYKEICTNIGLEFEELIGDKNCDYDSKDFYNGQNVIDIFFEGNQPVLDLKEFQKQRLAAEQVMNNNASMVLDEVGTGKTVAAIYAMQKVIQSRIDEEVKNRIFPSAAIMIICPNSKKEDWSGDIRRQLGRNSIIVNQNDNGKIIKQQTQSSSKPLIYVVGCKGGESDGSESELKLSFKKFHNDRKWDLVIIDECHDCFDNYRDIKAERIMLLTATPIRVSGNKVRNFDDYKNLMCSIIDENNLLGNIDPIKNEKPTEKDIFVCNYKEDIFNVEINRKIKFISCSRTENRQKWVNKLINEKDFFTAMYADQDDTRLSQKMVENFGNDLNDYNVESNKKLEKLEEIIKGGSNFEEYSTKSIIIFCELQDTVNMIYEKLSCLSNNKTMIGKKYSKYGEIKNITSNSETVLERLKYHINSDEGNRSILVTTGKSSGTGINLGEFDSVIHYELPYTSNELEQRFGRVERADDLIKKVSNDKKVTLIENEMIFLVNEPIGEENDLEANRMLEYSINKINITCKYMPIRNTVLFHPEFTKRLFKGIKEHIKKIQNSYGDEEDKEKKVEGYINYKKQEDYIKKLIKRINKSVDEKDKEKIKNEKNLKEQIRTILDNIKSNKEISENQIELKEFLELDDTEVIELENMLDRTFEYYILFRERCKFYGADVVGKVDFDEYNEETREKINEESGKRLFNKIEELKKAFRSKKITLEWLCEDIEEKINSIKTTQKANGVFYVVENKFINESVENFRKRGIK